MLFEFFPCYFDHAVLEDYVIYNVIAMYNFMMRAGWAGMLHRRLHRFQSIGTWQALHVAA